MKKIVAVLTLVALSGACASRPHLGSVNHQAEKTGKTPAVGFALSKSDLEKIDRTISHLNEEINELQSLNEKMYSKSLTADAGLEKEFNRKVDEYGSFDSLQANLKVLKELKNESQISLK